MNIFKKRETPVQNIAYIGIMSAINVIFVLISNFLPILFLLLVFILPLTSVVVTIYCKKRYLPIYIVTTIALCLIVTFGMNIFDTFIYVIPSLIVGILFGYLIEKEVPVSYILTVNTIVMFGLTYLTFYILDLATEGVSFYESIFKVFGLSNYQYKPVLINIFVYIIAQIQIIITYVLVKYEVVRLGININLESTNRIYYYSFLLIDFVLAILFYFLFPSMTIVFTLLALPIVIDEIISLCMKIDKFIYICLTAALVSSVFIFALLYKQLEAPNQFVLSFIFFGLVTIIDLLFNYCLKQKGEKIK